MRIVFMAVVIILIIAGAILFAEALKKPPRPAQITKISFVIGERGEYINVHVYAPDPVYISNIEVVGSLVVKKDIDSEFQGNLTFPVKYVWQDGEDITVTLYYEETSTGDYARAPIAGFERSTIKLEGVYVIENHVHYVLRVNIAYQENPQLMTIISKKAKPTKIFITCATEMCNRLEDMNPLFAKLNELGFNISIHSPTIKPIGEPGILVVSDGVTPVNLTAFIERGWTVIWFGYQPGRIIYDPEEMEVSQSPDPSPDILYLGEHYIDDKEFSGRINFTPALFVDKDYRIVGVKAIGVSVDETLALYNDTVVAFKTDLPGRASKLYYFGFIPKEDEILRAIFYVLFGEEATIYTDSFKTESNDRYVFFIDKTGLSSDTSQLCIFYYFTDMMHLVEVAYYETGK